MRDNKYGIFNFMEVQALLHDMKISKFRNFQVNLEGRTDGNRLTKIAKIAGIFVCKFGLPQLANKCFIDKTIKTP